MLANDYMNTLAAKKIAAAYHAFGIDLDKAAQKARQVKENTPKFAKNLDNLLRELTEETYNAAAELDMERAEAAGQRLASIAAVKERADFQRIEFQAEATYNAALIGHFSATGRDELGERFNKAAAKFTEALDKLGGPALTRFQSSFGDVELTQAVSDLLTQAGTMNQIAAAVDAAAERGVEAKYTDLNGGLLQSKPKKKIEENTRYLTGFACAREWENSQGPHIEADAHLAPAERWIRMLHDNHPQPGEELQLQLRPIAEQQIEAQLIADVWNYAINNITDTVSGEGNKLRAWKNSKSEISEFKRKTRAVTKHNAETRFWNNV